MTSALIPSGAERTISLHLNRVPQIQGLLIEHNVIDAAIKIPVSLVYLHCKRVFIPVRIYYFEYWIIIDTHDYRVSSSLIFLIAPFLPQAGSSCRAVYSLTLSATCNKFHLP